jgi:thiamine kinase-like enzyme
MCLAHHDYRLDNMLFGDGKIWVVDWQTLGWGPPAWDLSYFVGSSLDVEDRRAWERDLVQRHAERLRAAGISDWGRDIAWDAYRQMAYGTFLLTMPAAGEVRSNERTRQMYVAMWNRAATMVQDLGSHEFLEA